MATLLNIMNDIDPFQRYKMPSLELRYNHTRKRTYIANTFRVCSSLDRDQDLVALYFKKKLSSSINWIAKQEELELNGVYPAEKLQDILREFIDGYVLCRECSNPETRLRLKSSGDALSMRCKACGMKSTIKIPGAVFGCVLKYHKNKKSL